MSKLHSFFSLFYVLLILFCNKNDDLIAPTEDTRSISGFVYAAKDSTPLPNVAVSASGLTTAVTTDSSGKFVLLRLPQGNVTVHFEKEHYYSSQEKINLKGTQHILLDSSVYLKRDYFVIRGTVFDSLPGIPVPDMQVLLKSLSDSSLIGSTHTHDDGSYLFPYIVPDSGRYLIVVNKTGYQSAEICTTAMAGDSVFQMKYVFRNIGFMGTVFENDSITAVGTCLVTIGSKTSQSTSDGTFFIADLAHNTTQYIAELSKDGYFSKTCTLSVDTVDTVIWNGYLLPKLTIHGYVYERDGTTPVESVSIAFLDTFVSSNNLGLFQYQYLTSLSTGYLFTFSKSGYDSVLIHDTIKKNNTDIGPVLISKRMGHYKGRIRLQGSSDYSGTVVTVAGHTIADTTTADGEFLIHSIPIGIYSTTVTRDNYKGISYALEITENDTANLDSILIIQSGTLKNRVDWTDALSTYTIKDTLHIMESGSLMVQAGVSILLAENAKVLTDGYLSLRGTKNSAVMISPIHLAAAANEIEIRGGSGSDTAMIYTMLVNLKTILKNGPRIANSAFIFNHDPGNDNMVYLRSSTDTAYINHCEFFRYETNRGPFLFQDTAGAAGVVITNCIFSILGTSSTYSNFLKSQNKAQGITISIRNCDFFSENALPYALFSLINSDTNQVYSVDPLYTDQTNLDLTLQPSSPLLDKSTSGGKLGIIMDLVHKKRVK